MEEKPIKIARWTVFLLIICLAIVVLGVSGHLIAIRTTDYWRFAALAVAVSSITLLTLPFVLLASLFDTSTLPLLIAEAIWLSIMWILWLATGADATHSSRKSFARGACSFFTIYSSRTCNEFRVVEAFSYIIFIILLFYTIWLVACIATGSNEDRGAATRGAPETGQVKTAPGTQGQQQRIAPSGYSTDVPQDRQVPTQGRESGVPSFPQPESYRTS